MEDRKYMAYDLSSFINKQKNICFITGYMGSGKSTLAKSFGDRYDAIAISLDNVFTWNATYSSTNQKTPEQQKFRELLEHAGLYTNLGDGVGSFSSSYKNMSASQRCEAIIKQALMDCSINNRIILEGVQLYHYENLFNLFINQPLVIMSTSPKDAQKSDFNRSKGYGEKFFTLLKRIPYKNKYYANQLELFKEFLAKVAAVKSKRR